MKVLSSTETPPHDVMNFLSGTILLSDRYRTNQKKRRSLKILFSKDEFIAVYLISICVHVEAL